METTLQGAKTWSSEIGEFVDQRHILVAGMIADYDPRFSLAYLPVRDRGAFGVQKPWAIQERRNDGQLVTIRELTHADMENPGEIIAWMAFGDVAKRGPQTVLAELELKRLANEALKEREEEEARADAREMLATMVTGGRDRKHYYRHNGKTFRR